MQTGEFGGVDFYFNVHRSHGFEFAVALEGDSLHEHAVECRKVGLGEFPCEILHVWLHDAVPAWCPCAVVAATGGHTHHHEVVGIVHYIGLEVACAECLYIGRLEAYHEIEHIAAGCFHHRHGSGCRLGYGKVVVFF